MAQTFLDNGHENTLVNLCIALRDVVAEKYEGVCTKIIDGFVRTKPPVYWKNIDVKTVNIDSYFKK